MSTPARFAIFRVEKRKSLGAIASLGGHALRDRPTPNADPTRTPDNQVLAGADLADGAAVAAAISARIDQATHRRPDSVLALEVFVGVSPDWAKTATEEQWAAWRKASYQWLVEEFGRDNVVFLAEHRDETTRHLTGFVTPIRSDGRLSAAHWCGGGDRPGEKLSQMQDRHHAAVARVGLRRGIRGSQARHQDVQRFYGAAIAPPVPRVPPVEPPRLLDVATKDRREEWAKTQTAKVRRPIRDLARRAGAAEIERTRAEGQATTIRSIGRERDQLREEAAQLRGLPLDQVLERWQLVHDKAGSTPKESQWRDAASEHRITVTGTRWYDHHAQKGGGGAIDLVCHLERCQPKEAIAALAARFGKGAAVAATVADAAAKARQEAQEAAQAPPPPFAPPQPSEASWGRARRYLTQERRLSPVIVDEAHHRGDLYADARGNLVALQRDPAGLVVGAEVRGTGPGAFQGVSKGSQPSRGMWRMEVGQGGPLVLTESAIDALSLAELKGPTKPATYASTAGNASAQANHPVVAAAIESKRLVVVSVDNDDQGKRYVERYIECWGKAVRSLLPVLKDWNDMLKQRVTEGWRSGWEALHQTFSPNAAAPIVQPKPGD